MPRTAGPSAILRAPIPGVSARYRDRTTSPIRRAVPGGAGSRVTLADLRADPREAVQQDSIRCLVCGGAFRQLTNTHLQGHRMTAEEYKRRFGYNRGRPLMCHALRQLYADRAMKNRLASRIRQRPILIRPELRRQGGARTIALEELLTRREVRSGMREPHAAL
ncbi:MAG: MucR family transcriptional regulator [Candidatus Rokuibacteriota bacterium]